MKTFLDENVEGNEVECGLGLEYRDLSSEKLFLEWENFDDFESEKPECEVNRNNREYVMWVQRTLNNVLGASLAVDGISGPKTRSAVRSLQLRFGVNREWNRRAETIWVSLSLTPPRPIPELAMPWRRPNNRSERPWI